MKIIISIIVILSAQIGFAQNMQEQVEDKFGNLIYVQTDPVKGTVRSLSELKANISRYGTDAKELSSVTIERVSNSLLSDYIEFFDVEFSDLKFGHASNRNGKWIVKYSQNLNGVLVYGASIGFSTDKEGRIRRIGGNLYPNLIVDTTPSVSVSDAVSTAQDHFTAVYGTESRTDDVPLLYVYPMNKDGKPSTTIAYRFVLNAETASGKHIYFVDGHSGIILTDYSAYIQADPYFNVDGNLSRGYYLEHHYDTPLKSADNAGQTVTVLKLEWPLPTWDGTTSGSGYYNVFVQTDYTAGDDFKLFFTTILNFSGTYVKIMNWGSSGHNWFFDAPSSGSTLNHDAMQTNDESNVFHHANAIHDFYKASPFNYTEMDYQMYANVHDGSSISAEADKVDIYFGSADNQEWAKSSDVVFHEYTHNVIAHLYKDPGTGNPKFIKDYKENGTPSYWQARSMDEGISDYWAASINDDNIFGESVIVGGNCPGGPRNLMNDDQYDLFNFNTSCESRISSLVISGANWRMRQNLGDVDLANGLVFDALEFADAFTFREFLDMVLTADDDDASLSNGTPNIDDILYAYEHHGIYPNDLSVPPAKPKNISISSPGGNPRLDWDSNTEPDLNHYNIYRSVTNLGNPPGSFSYAGNTSNTYWVDTDWVTGSWKTAHYKIKAVDDGSNKSNYSSTVNIDVNFLIKSAYKGAAPTAYGISQNRPNPFNPETKITYSLKDLSYTKINIYNIMGQRVITLVDGAKGAGNHVVVWSGKDQFGSNVASGIYIYEISAISQVSGERFIDRKKMSLLK